jgi:hypothetical protein
VTEEAHAGAALGRHAARRVEQADAVAMCLDFDGNLAPIVDDPEQARPLPGTVDLLGPLAARFAADLSDKGHAVRRVMAESGARAVVVVGDDLGDLPAFAAVTELSGGTGGLKVAVRSAETRRHCSPTPTWASPVRPDYASSCDGCSHDSRWRRAIVVPNAQSQHVGRPTRRDGARRAPLGKGRRVVGDVGQAELSGDLTHERVAARGVQVGSQNTGS